MTLEQYAQASNYLIAAATGVLALAFVAYVAQWGFARRVAPGRELVGAVIEPVEMTPSTSSRVEVAEDRSDVAGGIGFSLTVLTWLVLLAGVVTRGLAAERVPWGNMYEFGSVSI